MRKEFWKKFFMGALALLLGLVTMANFIHALGIFLSDLGPEYLPLSIVSVSALVLAHSLLNVVAAQQVKADKIFTAAILFFIINYTALFYLPIASFWHSFYFFVIAFFVMWLHEGLLTQFTSSVFTPLQSKRYLPFVFGFMNLGLVLGALFAEPYKTLHELAGIGTLPIAGFGLVLVLIAVVGRQFKSELVKTLHEAHKKDILEEIQEGWRYLFGDSLLYRLLLVAVMLFVGLHISIDFKLKTVIAESFGHEEALIETLALVFMVRSLGAWILNALVVKGLLFRYGVSNLLIFFPASVLIVMIAAALFGLHYPFVIAVFLVFSLSHYSYYEICLSQMLAVVPEKFAHGVHFLIHGLFYSFGMVGFSLLLLFYTNDISLEPTMNTGIIIVLSAMLIPLFMRIKGLYFSQLKANLNGRDEFLKLRSIDLFAEASSIKSGETYLRRMLELPTLKPDVKARVIGSLGVIGNYQTIVDLTQMLLNDTNPKIKLEAIHAINTIIRAAKKLDKVPVTKHYLLRTYEKILLSDVPSYVKSEVIAALKYFDLEDVMSFLERHLHDENVQIQQNVLKTLATFKDRGIIPYLEPFLNDEHLGLQSEAIVGLWQFEEMRIKVLPRLTSLLASHKPEAAAHTLSIIGSIHATWEKDYVHRQLSNENEHIRMHALVTLIELGDIEHVSLFAEKLLGFARQEDVAELDFAFSHYRKFPESVRSSVVKMIQEMSDQDSALMLESFRQSKYVFSNEVAALSVK